MTTKIKLPNVTLIAAGSAEYKYAHQMSLDKCMESIDFGAVKNITFDCKSLEDYSRFMLFELWKHIDTDFALVIQADSWVLRPELWTNEFLDYDYVGAPWVADTHFTAEGVGVRVGNGGFSLRSKKLLKSFIDLNLPFTDGGKGFTHEDGQISNYHRKTLEDSGIKFAPVKLAALFSHETDVPESVPSFGFHKHM